MAIPNSGSSPRRKRRWGYMRVGYRRRPIKDASGSIVGYDKGRAVYRWVRVGSPLWSTLRSKGITASAIRRGPRPSATPTSHRSPDTQDRISRSPAQRRKDRAMANKVAANVKARVDRRAGGGGGKRRRGGKGGGGSATVDAVNQRLGISGSYAGKKLGAGYADELAGAQFDPQIRDMKVLIERLGPQNAQAIADLTSWYGQAGQLNARAGARAGEIMEGVAGDQEAAIGNLMAALGGGANTANTALAAKTLNDTGYLRALGGIEQQYHADMDPILANAAANAKTQEQRRNLVQMQDYQLQLANLMGQRGQAKAAAMMDIEKYNNDLEQQYFQNKLASLNAALGAEAAGVDLAMKRAALRAQGAQSRGGRGGKVSWMRLNPAEKDDLLMRAIGARQTPEGYLRPTRTLAQAQSWLNNNLRHRIGSGRNDGILTLLRQYYR